jgi:hypothetical protein
VCVKRDVVGQTQRLNRWIAVPRHAGALCQKEEAPEGASKYVPETGTFQQIIASIDRGCARSSSATSRTVRPERSNARIAAAI